MLSDGIMRFEAVNFLKDSFDMFRSFFYTGHGNRCIIHGANCFLATLTLVAQLVLRSKVLVVPHRSVTIIANTPFGKA